MPKNKSKKKKRLVKPAKSKYSKKAQEKIGRVMKEFHKGKLRSGSKKGPKVKNRKQAVAIALSEARRKGHKVPGRRG
jgi:hypothetical protein